MSPRKPEQLLRQGAERLGLLLRPDEIRDYLIYLEALKRWNRAMNLTANRGNTAIIEKHFLDSLMGIQLFAKTGRHGFADIGTGAGFPGIPLKLHDPGRPLTLVEASRKKVAFLLYLRGLLKLESVSILDKRVEALALLPEYKGQYEVIVSRAFAKPPATVQSALPLLAPGGQLLLYLSASGADLLEGLADWEAQRLDYRLPFSGADRALLLLSRAA